MQAANKAKTKRNVLGGLDIGHASGGEKRPTQPTSHAGILQKVFILLRFILIVPLIIVFI